MKDLESKFSEEKNEKLKEVNELIEERIKTLTATQEKLKKDLSSYNKFISDFSMYEIVLNKVNEEHPTLFEKHKVSELIEEFKKVEGALSDEEVSQCIRNLTKSKCERKPFYRIVYYEEEKKLEEYYIENAKLSIMNEMEMYRESKGYDYVDYTFDTHTFEDGYVVNVFAKFYDESDNLDFVFC